MDEKTMTNPLSLIKPAPGAWKSSSVAFWA